MGTVLINILGINENWPKKIREQMAQDNMTHYKDTGISEVNRKMEEKLLEELEEAELKAWEALNRYKFQMFGYWAAIWVHLNRITGQAKPNPWRDLVLLSREKTGFVKS